ncbi:hypothetical protein GN956_G11496 [Arapaima gigas]
MCEYGLQLLPSSLPFPQNPVFSRGVQSSITSVSTSLFPKLLEGWMSGWRVRSAPASPRDFLSSPEGGSRDLTFVLSVRKLCGHGALGRRSTPAGIEELGGGGTAHSRLYLRSR